MFNMMVVGGVVAPTTVIQCLEVMQRSASFASGAED